MTTLPLNTPVAINCPKSAAHGLTGRISDVGYGGAYGNRPEYMIELDVPINHPQAYNPITHVGPFVKSRLRVIPAVTDVVLFKDGIGEPVPCEQVEGDAHPIIVVIGGWQLVNGERKQKMVQS